MDRSQRRNGSIYRQHPGSKPQKPSADDRRIWASEDTEWGLERIAYLRLKPSRSIFSMMEISQEPSSIESYLPEFEINGRTFRQDFDYIWFTSRQEMKIPAKPFVSKMGKLHFSL